MRTETARKRGQMSFGQTLHYTVVRLLNIRTATALETYFKSKGLEVSHQAINSYYSERSLPEPDRLLAMMEALELDYEERRVLVETYADRRPGLRQICLYLQGEN
jgi:hypothetical protein